MILSALDNLAFTCNAVLPIILLILIGYFLKRIKLLPDNFWKMANKLCFKLCLPAMLFINIYNVSDISGIAKQWRIVLYCVIAIVLIFFIGLLFVIIFVKDSKQKGVVLQCVFRSNFAIIGVSLAESLSNGSSEPVALAAVISAISIPLFNVLAIISLSIFIKDENNSKVSAKDIVLKIIKNPLIIGVFLGIVALGIRALLSINRETPLFTIKSNLPFLYTTINYLKQMASPLALIALGGDFTFSAVSRLKKQIIYGVVGRVIFTPLVCLTIVYLINKNNLLNVDNSVCFPALIALFGTPVATSSAPMASEMGNDEELAGQLVVWTSVVSVFSLFAIIFTCSSMGIFG